MSHINFFLTCQFSFLNTRGSNKHVTLQNLPIYYTWKNIRKWYEKNKLKTIAQTWNDEFESPDGVRYSR